MAKAITKPPKAASQKKTSLATKVATARAVPSFEGLKKWNVTLAVLHALQGVAILLLATPNAFSVTTSFLTKDSLASEAGGKVVLAPATQHLFDVNLAYLVAGFFFLSALA